MATKKASESKTQEISATEELTVEAETKRASTQEVAAVDIPEVVAETTESAVQEIMPFKVKCKRFFKGLWETMRHSAGWTSICVVGIVLIVYMIIVDFT